MSSRLGWIVALSLVIASGALIVLVGTGDAASRSPQPVPTSAESARAAVTRAQFADGDTLPVVLVVTRTDGGRLDPADVATIRSRTAGARVNLADDGVAAVVTTPLRADLSGFALNDAVTAVRAAARDGLPDGLAVQVTGGPAFGADIANSFTGANLTLLAVTAAVVALLLIVTYRSPVLWLAPLLVIAFADRVAAVLGAAIATALGTSPDGATSGITSVLVFGAGTNYALLLISRYREELGAARDDGTVDESGSHRVALRVAVRHAAPAIVASNATVVLALLTLLLATSPSTRALGVQAAAGLVVAAVFVLIVLPSLLGLFGTRLFWPFVPKPGGRPLTTTGAWHRVAAAVARRPGPVAAAAIALLVVSSLGLVGTSVGLSQTDQFRVRAESVQGYQTLSAHFPGGLSDPAVVVAPVERADAVTRAISSTPGVVAVNETGRTPSGLVRYAVILDAAPGSAQAFETVAALRSSAHGADEAALVGGSDAAALDARAAAGRDQRVIIPAILAVVLIVLYALLRTALAPLVLVSATVLSAGAAIGLGGWVSRHAFGFPALADTTPLFAFLFLVALGVDYTIFLVTRAREETPEHGNRDGIVRAVSATGAVITSAGVVLAAVFCVLGVLPLIVLAQIGIIVGLGILLDTFVVRTLVIPASFVLIGPRIWWPALRPNR